MMQSSVIVSECFKQWNSSLSDTNYDLAPLSSAFKAPIERVRSMNTFSGELFLSKSFCALIKRDLLPK